MLFFLLLFIDCMNMIDFKVEWYWYLFAALTDGGSTYRRGNA